MVTELLRLERFIIMIIGTTKKDANKEQNGTNKELNWEKLTKVGPFGVLSFMKIPLESSILDQRSRIVLGTLNFIVQLCLC